MSSSSSASSPVPYKIPPLVHQTFISAALPQAIHEVVESNKRISKYCTFHFYDDAVCDAFIATHFDKRTLNAYRRINPVYGAMRADFFRYCVLYILGGTYADIKTSICVPLYQVIQPEDICILDICRGDLESWRARAPTYEQWLLMFAPRHPYLQQIIENMIQKIERGVVPQCAANGTPLHNSKQRILHITGPDAFSEAVRQVIARTGKKWHRTIRYDNFFKYQGISEATKEEMYRLHKKKHYSHYKEPLYLPTNQPTDTLYKN